jgi:nucleoid DNA-binding protein
MKIYIQAAQVFISIQSILKIDHLEECIQNMKRISPIDIHESTPFVSELSSFLDSDDESYVIQYAVRLKQLNTLLESYETKFVTILNKIFTQGKLRPLSSSEMNSHVKLTKQTMKEFFKTRDAVCLSAFNMFEVIVEQQRLHKIMATIEKLESLEKNFYP